MDVSWYETSGGACNYRQIWGSIRRRIRCFLPPTLKTWRPSALFVAVVFVGALFTGRWTFSSLTTATTTNNNNAALNPKAVHSTTRPIKPFTCPSGNLTALICPSQTLARPPPIQDPHPHHRSRPICPDYFRWIHEDLKPWKATGISRQAVDLARKTANFRLVILDGRAYVETFKKSFQTRDVFTLWGVVQLLRRYPGRLPDLELMFDCVDWPVVKAADYRTAVGGQPPPVFRYCGDESTLDIVFPDWSFWGWAEINIKPWEGLLKDLMEGKKRVAWMERVPYAYWKGNPAVAVTRQELLRCNVSEAGDWNARVYAQDWLSEVRDRFKQSDLASQCDHRYKIYIEGSAWSVSEKYILACDSPTLVVTPRYYDFFTRDLMPVHHYWPIRDDDKCRSIKFAVDWGNRHKRKAQAIGKAASTFIQEELKMDYVYDYMFHLLHEYAKLLKFKPVKPQNAVEICAASMACRAKGLERKFMMESMVNASHDLGPCELPPPYDPVVLDLLHKRKANSIKQVEIWEQGTGGKQKP
ncbi:hypothetical protein QJS04_geneDACA001953 [Acorus gramineus]|uniref:Glycosyl transferase CAP10 domain-containing protein n=1 Tax=Acorus gramineus TaxID=55184 RepID=A0AAV9A7T1_ACOGR|nr:hypothetical protein QJS04_geneDACA001953 [Acorus gramineus]